MDGQIRRDTVHDVPEVLVRVILLIFIVQIYRD